MTTSGSETHPSPPPVVPRCPGPRRSTANRRSRPAAPTPGSLTYETFAMDLVRIEDSLVTEIITFNSDVFEWFRLPTQLEGS